MNTLFRLHQFVLGFCEYLIALHQRYCKCRMILINILSGRLYLASRSISY